MGPKPLSAMANIAAQLAAHDDHIEVYMFWYDFRRDYTKFPDNVLESRSEFLSFWEEDVLMLATGFIRDVMNARADALDAAIYASGERPLLGVPLDYPVDVGDVNTWFDNDDDYQGGIVLVPVSL